MNSDWRRVTKMRPCPICRKPDWCMIADDGTVAICARIESGKRCGDGGWLHRLGAPTNGKAAIHHKHERSSHVDFAFLVEAYRKSANGQLCRAAAELGVSPASLMALHAGWDGEALTFPMRDAAWKTVGIRKRYGDGRRRCVEGSHEGCFGPCVIPDGPVWIAEGPTDCAALLTLGLNAIGRPSCSGGTKIIAAIAACRNVVIVADNDAPGLRGATTLMKALIPLCKSVDVMEPPFGCKDAREAINRGAAKRDFAQ